MDAQSPDSIAFYLKRELLQDIQTRFASLARVNALICDHAGAPVTRLTTVDPYCKLLLDAPGTHDDHLADLARLAAELRDTRAEHLIRPCAHGGLKFIAMPIRVSWKPVGLLVVVDRPDAALSDDHLGALAAQAGHDPAALREAAAAVAPPSSAEIERRFTFQRLIAHTLTLLCAQEARLRSRVDELSAVYSISGLLAAGHGLQHILDETARLVREVMHMRAASIRLLNAQTGELEIVAVSNLSPEYLNKGPLRLERNAIDQAAIRGEIVYVRNLATDPRAIYPEQIRREGLASCLVAGMTYQGKPIGVIRAYAATEKSFDSFDAALLRVMATSAAAAIANARLLDDALEAERYARQLRLAADVQRRMLPLNPPSTPQLELACLYEPSLELGGDLCDFIELDEGRRGLVIADVVGKGLAASVLMASIRGTLRTLARTSRGLVRIMQTLNDQLCRDTLPAEFATLFYGEISPDGRSVTYCNAGHDPPLLLRGAEFIELHSTGLAVGIDPRAEYETGRLRLRPGDILLLYTDGCVDALDFNDVRFGRPRLRDSLRRYADLPAERLARSILWDIRRFIGLARQTDDITLVLARVK